MGSQPLRTGKNNGKLSAVPVILNYTEGVNPDISDFQFSGNNDYILECLWKFIPRNIPHSLTQVALGRSELICAPAMAQCNKFHIFRDIFNQPYTILRGGSDK
jgi:hypothetical protein